MKNQSGFTLVEMMIVVAILTIVALGLSGYMSNLSKQQQAAQTNIEVMQLKTFVHSIAIDPESIHTSSIIEITNKSSSGNGDIGLPEGASSDPGIPAGDIRHPAGDTGLPGGTSPTDVM